MTLKTRKFLGVFLAVAMAAPSTAAVTSTGTVKGVVSMTGHVLGGIALTLVNVETGKSFSVQSGADGSFSAVLPTGSYVFSSPGKAGVAISRAPLSVEVLSGKVASANVEVAALSAQQQTASVTGDVIKTYDVINCITEGEYTVIQATFDPPSAVVVGKLNFKSNLSEEYFYTEFEKITGAVPGGPTHQAFIPKVLQGGGITGLTYYILVTATDFAESRTPEQETKIVTGATDCEGKLGDIPNPAPANITVLSASGQAAGALAGFGGVAAGTAITTGAIVAAVAAAAAGTAVAVSGDSPTPTPTVVVTPTPTPTPVATPTPALCSISFGVLPDSPAPIGVGGRYCSISVVTQTQGTFLVNAPGGTISGIPCTDRVVAFANVAPESSITTNRLPADWSNRCTGSALGVPCVFNPPLATTDNLGLTCSTR